MKSLQEVITENEMTSSESKKSIVNESLSITDTEKILLLRSLYTIYNFAKRGDILTRYEADYEVAPLYKKIFNITSKDIQSNDDFGNGNVSKAENLSFWK